LSNFCHGTTTQPCERRTAYLRVGLILEYFDACGDEEYIDIAHAVLLADTNYSAWLDGTKLVELRQDLKTRGDKFVPLSLATDELLSSILEWSTWPDSLEKIARALSESPLESGVLLEKCKHAVENELNNYESSIETFESHSELTDYYKDLEKLVSIFPELSSIMEDAKEVIEEKLEYLEGRDFSSDSPIASSPTMQDEDYSDQQIANLFATLI